MKTFKKQAFKKYFIFGIIFMIFILPVAVSAAGIVPCTSPGFGSQDNGVVCDWSQLMVLARKLVKYLILLSTPVAACLFAYAGFMMVTAGPDTGKREQAKKIFLDVFVGFLFVLAAWLIVHLITSALLNPKYSLLGGIK